MPCGIPQGFYNQLWYMFYLKAWVLSVKNGFIHLFYFFVIII